VGVIGVAPGERVERREHLALEREVRRVEEGVVAPPMQALAARAEHEAARTDKLAPEPAVLLWGLARAVRDDERRLRPTQCFGHVEHARQEAFDLERFDAGRGSRAARARWLCGFRRDLVVDRGAR